MLKKWHFLFLARKKTQHQEIGLKKDTLECPRRHFKFKSIHKSLKSRKFAKNYPKKASTRKFLFY